MRGATASEREREGEAWDGTEREKKKQAQEARRLPRRFVARPPARPVKRDLPPFFFPGRAHSLPLSFSSPLSLSS